ncbi:MAG: TIGR00341 family protein, partial [Micrococcales bacterium]|nr:TIGR00341 family protein [Micrococcales bacterium]
MSRITEALIPPSQRLSADELHETLNLGAGEVGRKRSAFLIMLVLSAIIAAAGVLGG